MWITDKLLKLLKANTKLYILWSHDLIFGMPFLSLCSTHINMFFSNVKLHFYHCFFFLKLFDVFLSSLVKVSNWMGKVHTPFLVVCWKTENDSVGLLTIMTCPTFSNIAYSTTVKYSSKWFQQKTTFPKTDSH